jgi:hypothetical protein
MDPQASRALRSVLVVIICTTAAMASTSGGFYPPRSHPLVYALAMSWLISLAAVILTGAIFKVTPGLFVVARWEHDGTFYERMGVGAFRWVVRQTPLGWINGNLHMAVGRADCERLIKELNTAEGVHWVTAVASSTLAIWCLADGYAAHGLVLLLVRIPYDLYPIMLQRQTRGRVTRLMNRPSRVAV